MARGRGVLRVATSRAKPATIRPAAAQPEKLAQFRKDVDTAVFACSTFGIFICINEHVGSPCIVTGPSMLPNVAEAAILVINKLPYRRNSLKLGDVVAAQHPEELGKKIIKRIKGMPGDVVKVEIPEEWDPERSKPEIRTAEVPKGHVWVEGDNAFKSTDSRYYGPIPMALVRGVVVFRLYPFYHFGPMPRKCAE